MSGDLISRWYAPGTAGKSRVIYNADEIMVDYRDGMLRISQFADGHWVDEHFVELTPDLMGKKYESPELRTCYCPICDKHFEVRSNDSMGNCPDCGHHVVLHGVEVADD